MSNDFDGDILGPTTSGQILYDQFGPMIKRTFAELGYEGDALDKVSLLSTIITFRLVNLALNHARGNAAPLPDAVKHLEHSFKEGMEIANFQAFIRNL